MMNIRRKLAICGSITAAIVTVIFVGSIAVAGEHIPSALTSGTVPNTPSPVSTIPSPASTTASLTSICQTGFIDPDSGSFVKALPAADLNSDVSTPETAYLLTLTNNGNATADVAGFAVTFYDSSGNELGSDQENYESGFITPGQRLDWTVNSEQGNVPANAATCSLVQWTTGDGS